MGETVSETVVEGRNRGWRRVAVVVLLVAGCVLMPLAVSSIWLRNQVTDTDSYVRTVKPLASNQAIQDAVAANVTNALFSRVDVAGQAREALPPKADFLAAPLAAGLRTVTTDVTLRLLDSPRFQELWLDINRLAHEQLVKVLTGQGRLASATNGKVVLDLTPVVDEVRSELDARGVTIFDKLPQGSVRTSFTLIDSRGLEQAQTAVRLLKAAAIVLPILALACLALAVGLSRQRRRTMLQLGLGVALSMLVLGILLTVGRSVYLDYVVGPNLPADAAKAFYDIVVNYLRVGVRAIAALALLISAGAWVTGPARPAVAIRRWFGGLLSRAQDETGLGSGPVATWVGANRRPLRLSLVVLATAVFFLWSSPTVTLLVTLVVLVLVGMLVIELVARAPSRHA